MHRTITRDDSPIHRACTSGSFILKGAIEAKPNDTLGPPGCEPKREPLNEPRQSFRLFRKEPRTNPDSPIEIVRMGGAASVPTAEQVANKNKGVFV